MTDMCHLSDTHRPIRTVLQLSCPAKIMPVRHKRLALESVDDEQWEEYQMKLQMDLEAINENNDLSIDSMWEKLERSISAVSHSTLPYTGSKKKKPVRPEQEPLESLYQHICTLESRIIEGKISAVDQSIAFLSSINPPFESTTLNVDAPRHDIVALLSDVERKI